MEIISAEYGASMPCVESNKEDQKSYWSSDFEVDFENDKNENFRLKGTVNCDIIDETDYLGEDDRQYYSLGNFTFNFLNQIVNDEFTKPTHEEMELMKIAIENYINNKF